MVPRVAIVCTFSSLQAVNHYLLVPLRLNTQQGGKYRIMKEKTLKRSVIGSVSLLLKSLIRVR